MHEVTIYCTNKEIQQFSPKKMNFLAKEEEPI